MIQEKESEIEAEKLLTELRSSTEGAKMLLSGRESRQVEQWIEIAESEVEGQNILAYELLCEKLGKMCIRDSRWAVHQNRVKWPTWYTICAPMRKGLSTAPTFWLTAERCWDNICLLYTSRCV